MSTHARSGFESTAPNDRVHQSREDALDDRAFEALFDAAYELDPYYGEQAQFCILVLGRLGLRKGELAHMQDSWIDWREQMIHIPRHEPCDKGRGGGICGYCKQLAEQRVAHDDPDEGDEPLTREAALDDCWRAKTEAASRAVYFGWDPRTELFIERFFDRYDAFPVSTQAINRRVNRVAEHTPGLDVADVYPHALRATACSHLASKGLEMTAMLQHFGWSKPSTSNRYLSRNAQATARQLTASQTR